MADVLADTVPRDHDAAARRANAVGAARGARFRGGEATVRATNTGGTIYPWGTETYRETIEHRTSDDNPAVTSMLGTHLLEIELEDRTLRFEGGLDFRSDADNFYYEYFRRLTEDGEVVREKRWTETIPRDYQ